MFKSFSTFKKKHIKSHSTVSYPLPAPSPCLIPPLLVIQAKTLSQVGISEAEIINYKIGDFLHVIGEDTDPEKYFVCNPITNSTGWVIKNNFEVITKARRTNNLPTQTMNPHNRSISLTTNSSAHSGSTANTLTNRATDITLANSAGGGNSLLIPNSPNSSFHSQGKSNTSSAYSFDTKSVVIAICLYEFIAEREDELSIDKGDQLSICAKSDSDWMVCKHIGRPTGPGLVPVDYLEFREFDNGNQIEDLEDYLNNRGILLPTVPEWKALSSQLTTTSFRGHSRSSSENTNSQPRHSQVPSLEHSPLENPTSHSLSTTSSLVQPHSPTFSIPLEASPVSLSQPSIISIQVPTIPASGEIHRVINDNNLYYYIIEVNYPQQSIRKILYRLYEDFQTLHHALTQYYQNDEDTLSLLPLLPPPISYIDSQVANKRKPALNLYFQQLLALPKQILNSDYCQSFLHIRSKDIELEVQLEDTQRYTNMTINSTSFFNGEDQDSSDDNATPQTLDHLTSTESESEEVKLPTSPLRIDKNFLDTISPPPIDSSASSSPNITSNFNSDFIKAKVLFQDEILAFKVPKSEGMVGLITRIYLRLEDTPQLCLMVRDLNGDYLNFDNSIDFDGIEKSKTGQLVIYAKEVASP
ncbi:hypothetical protein CONCODRAFT_78456 [Conidiobolus coronatus NRRL 28638]|uniref:Phox-like protein n=1 Tax=Conidiobolus coronatus (strain ATCC 28846 / CBS 209.66 / NRRL 28638) TaxID=796925 RepID=A0A137P8C9_CONC2|nr:hypothetical protein CONCODRAFT_78456 [Conidiobolus coronatus NRRL 28638]|eukprot:KXN71204.1 hypothetical protein CONCODRAFT_78456 [Conidiobolus coronatus NRRL 28638]